MPSAGSEPGLWDSLVDSPNDQTEQAFYSHLFTTHNINHTGVGARRGRQEINKDSEPLGC